MAPPAARSAVASQIYSVSNRSQLLAAISNGGFQPKIIKVVGSIDMSEGQPFTSTADQKARGQVKAAQQHHADRRRARQWLRQRLDQHRRRQQCHRAQPDHRRALRRRPIWDPTDGATGNWNAAYDAISVTGADHVWIDRNTITDVPVTDNLLPIENGKTRQCHDGAIDITKAADYVSVTNNIIEMHDKTMLIGSSDTGNTAAADVGRLKVTIAGNYF